ncbi:MAG: imidazole glycerol phosphate synthase subunit HisH [candidate division Zixibacteria bacterium]|nr:imidazole glycerol phosphate synthase subunit HisH [candidate division Zixibacteria bacterium]
MLTIVDYHSGNLGSILNMLKKLGVPAKISSRPEDIKNADKLILPGVGAFDTGMANIQKLGLFDILNEKVLEDKTPLLGICLGMQLLAERSDEGDLPGLGWLKGDIVRFKFNGPSGELKVPHMGWNSVSVINDNSLFKDIDEPRFYFVHSYHFRCEDSRDVLATTDYGYEFPASVHRDNIWGTQFHPEKSHRFGLQLLKNFVEQS